VVAEPLPFWPAPRRRQKVRRPPCPKCGGFIAHGYPRELTCINCGLVLYQQTDGSGWKSPYGYAVNAVQEVIE